MNKLLQAIIYALAFLLVWLALAFVMGQPGRETLLTGLAVAIIFAAGMTFFGQRRAGGQDHPDTGRQRFPRQE